MSIVRTKEELEKAINSNDPEIIIEGELAEKIRRGRKIKNYSAATITTLGGAIAATFIAAPFTGGLSFFAAVPIAALTGVEISLIIIAVSVGLALLLAVWNNYEEFEFSVGPPPRLIVRKKQRA